MNTQTVNGIVAQPMEIVAVPKLAARHVSVYYGAKLAVCDVSVELAPKSVTAFVGPPRCGKSAFLRAINRTRDMAVNMRVEGEILLDGVDVHDPSLDVRETRRRIGMVTQKPSSFPGSIHDNVAYGVRIHGLALKTELDDLVEHALRGVGLWDDVKDRLRKSARGLPAGQQQRLCIARTIAAGAEVILMDEPCAALDPAATAMIEDIVHGLGMSHAVVIGTHDMRQAARLSQRTGFFHLGHLVEYGDTSDIFTNPREKRTKDYITGRYG